MSGCRACCTAGWCGPTASAPSWSASMKAGSRRFPGFVALVRRDNFLGVVAETEWGAIQAAAKLGSTLNPSGPDAGQAKWSAWNGLPAMDKIWETVRDATRCRHHQGQPRRGRARPRRGRAKARGDLPDAVSDARLDRSVLRHRRCEGRPGDLLVGDPDAARGSAGHGAVSVVRVIGTRGWVN